jgi:CII-binding regulator of phage lambda lysogenization HflD
VHALRLDRHQLAARIAACYTKILAHLQTRIDIYSECRFLGRPDSMATKLTLYAQLRDLRAEMRLGAWVR